MSSFPSLLQNGLSPPSWEICHLPCPPAKGITKTSGLPDSADVDASHRPFGERLWCRGLCVKPVLTTRKGLPASLSGNAHISSLELPVAEPYCAYSRYRPSRDQSIGTMSCSPLNNNWRGPLPSAGMR